MGDVPRPRLHPGLGRARRRPGRDRGGTLATELGAPYAYLIYPHKPIVAYLPQTRELLNEYCVEFPDETRPYGSARLPDSDDVLAKWMALTGDERRLIETANMHLPGRQVDPKHVRRDLWRLQEWERQRMRRRARADADPAGRDSGSADSGSAAVLGPVTETLFDLKHKSRALTDGPERAAARAYLKGIGFDDEALAKPIIGVASTWIETMPCNFHLRALAAKVKEGIRAAGGTPMEFNTIAISDGITMGTSGMKTSLVSREVIADSIELVAPRPPVRRRRRALAAATRRSPARVMALARLDLPGVMLYGGSIPPGRLHGQRRHDPGRLRGRRRARRGQDDRRRSSHELEDVASPGAGACGGQFTANTMAMAFEVLGISPMGSSMVPAQDTQQGRRSRSRPASSSSTSSSAACTPRDIITQRVARERDRRRRD